MSSFLGEASEEPLIERQGDAGVLSFLGELSFDALLTCGEVSVLLIGTSLSYPGIYISCNDFLRTPSIMFSWLKLESVVGFGCRRNVLGEYTEENVLLRFCVARLDTEGTVFKRRFADVMRALSSILDVILIQLLGLGAEMERRGECLGEASDKLYCRPKVFFEHDPFR